MTQGRGLKNDHYVPQFLLRHFARDGKVFVFDKFERRTFRTNPRNIMSERGYNSVTLKGGAWIEFERQFTLIEDHAKPILTEIIRSESVASMSVADRAVLSTFLVVQHLRARAIRDNYLSIGATIRARFPGVEANDFPEEMENAEFDKFAFIKGTMDDLGTFVGPVAAKHLFLLKWSGTDPMYISDNPFVMNNLNDLGPYGNIGLAVPGIEIYFPISPTLVLALLCPTTVADIKANLAKAELAYSEVASELFSGDTAEVARKMKLRSELKAVLERTRAYHKQMFEDRLVHVSNENLLYLNSLQIKWAKRYIASATGDFSFAQKALAERPGWVAHPTIEM